MASANAAVIYGTVSGLVRWYVHADTDAEIQAVQPGTGESLILVPLATTEPLAAYQAAVNAHTGLTPPDPRCAVLDSGNNVVMTVKGDAALDSASVIHPQGASLMQCGGNPVGVADRWNSAVPRWERFYSVVNRATNIVAAQAWLALVNPVPPNAVTQYTAPSSFPIGATVTPRVVGGVTVG